MKLSTKLGASFGLVLLLLALVSYMGFNALNYSTNGFSEYRELARNTNALGRIQANLLSMRIAALAFYGTGQAEKLAEQKERFSALDKIITDAEQSALTDEQLELYKEIHSEVNDYNKVFGEITKLMEQRDEFVNNKLNKIGPLIERSLTRILLSSIETGNSAAITDASKTIRNLMLARLYVMKFISENDQDSVDRVEKERIEFINNLKALAATSLDSEAKLLEEIDAYQKAYFDAFSGAVTTIQTRNALKIDKLDPAGQLVAKLSEDEKLRIKSRQDELGPLVQTANSDAVSLITIVSLVAIVIGVILTFIITRAIVRPINNTVKLAETIAKGDLTSNIVVESNDEMGKLTDAMKLMSDQLSQVISDVSGAASSISSASEQMNSTAIALSNSATEQAGSVEETSASVEQMSASINQNTDNANITSDMANKAAKEAVEGGEAVKQTVSAMNSIAEKIGIIDDIAYQTNLLALNAAIEAARAGEHGKGFAVVAAEVRKLAERSQVAAQDIGEVAQNSVGLAEKAGKLLGEIVPSIQNTSDLVQEISAASEEQSAGVNQINVAMQQLDKVTQQNAAGSEQLAATSDAMKQQASNLTQIIAFFRLADSRMSNTTRTSATPVAMASANNESASIDEANFERF